VVLRGMSMKAMKRKVSRVPSLWSPWTTKLSLVLVRWNFWVQSIESVQGFKKFMGCLMNWVWLKFLGCLIEKGFWVRLKHLVKFHEIIPLRVLSILFFNLLISYNSVFRETLIKALANNSAFKRNANKTCVIFYVSSL
jgi:hypothetical protein